MPIRFKASFMQPLICATASAATSGRQSWRASLSDPGWNRPRPIGHGGPDGLALEIVLQHESWHGHATKLAARD